MKYLSKEELVDWVEVRVKKNSSVTLFAVLFLFVIAVIIYFEKNKQMSDRFIFGIVGTLFHVILFIYVYFNNSNTINRTIEEIEIKEGTIVFKTFPCEILCVYIINKQVVSEEVENLSFFLSQYRLSNQKNDLGRECYTIKINGEEYYLLYKYFDDELLSALNIKVS